MDLWRNTAAVMLSLATLGLSGCATVTVSEKPPSATQPDQVTVSIADVLPADKYLPEQSASVPDTRFVVVQSGGGSMLLGPIFGSLNISARTKDMADSSRGQYVGISPVSVARTALAGLDIYRGDGGASYIVKPFVFLQHCYDDKFRMSLVFHVERTSTSWVGRYIYDLPTVIPVAEFGNPSNEQVTDFQREMSAGATALAGLLRADLLGNMPHTGTKVTFGSLWVIGNKLGGMGIYTMPEELRFKDVELLEETDSYITVRMKGNMHATGLFGGLAFGVHRINKNMVHTFRRQT